jgi:hypothetical protein
MGRNNGTVRAGPSVDGLVTRARAGDLQAWDALVERYASQEAELSRQATMPQARPRRPDPRPGPPMAHERPAIGGLLAACPTAASPQVLYAGAPAKQCSTGASEETNPTRR